MSGPPTPDPPDAIQRAFSRRAEREREARRMAERLLEEKSLELFEANEALRSAQSELEQQFAAVQAERDRVVQLSRMDPLTLLGNRTATFEGLLSALEHQETKAEPDGEGRQVWLVLLLLKRFKRVNAYLGQIGGDLAIQTVADRLKRCVDQEHALIARYSGTEFAFVLSATEAELGTLLETVSRSLSEPLTIQGRTVELDFVIAAAGSETAGGGADKIRMAVDQALSKARRREPRQVHIYDHALAAEISRQKTLESEILNAVSEGEFVSWFQPILSCEEADTICLEALARWPRNGGLVAPDEFIPASVDLGVWDTIDEQLFQSACHQAKPLIEAGLVTDLSVNITPLQLSLPGFVPQMARRLEALGFPARHLILEITEDALVDDPDMASRQIHKLHDLGVKIAVDDFGTGYSNLRNLIGLPIDGVKIDRSLVSDIHKDNRATMLVSTLVQWARAINVSVVAEGVENETQATLLRALGCNRVQGFHFARAMSAKRLVDRIPSLLQGTAGPGPAEAATRQQA